MTVHYYRIKEYGDTAIERLCSYIYECLMSFISIAMYIFMNFMIKLSFERWGVPCSNAYVDMKIGQILLYLHG